MHCSLVVRKRCLEAEPHRARLCLEAELQLDHHPMETSQSQIAAIQKQEEQVLVRSSPPRATLCCPRCLGGEPGHINHIMGL
ncbi:uncharacterized protein KZ484_009025 isoform 4-T5 [Pholidichthys leucotaenia]